MDVLEKMTPEEICEKFIKLIRIKLPDGFYALPNEMRHEILNAKFPVWLASLSVEDREFVKAVARLIIRGDVAIYALRALF